MDSEPSIINQTKQNVIPKLKESFVNDYDFWKNIIESTNNAIQIQSDSNLNLYNYDEFCIQFVEHLENKHDNIEFSHQLIQKILLEMIKFKRL